MPSTKAEWIQAGAAVLTVLGVGVGLYGTYRADLASSNARISNLEKVAEVSTIKMGAMENELDVLWVDTQKNEETLRLVRKDQERFDKAFIKFAEATDRLSVSVARLEERMRFSEGKNGG
jgi:hypothetical protein